MANEPITREEILLNAVATGEATNLEPITREEMFLAKLGGADVNTPMPITRKEQFLQKAIESGGSGGTGGGGDIKALVERSITEIEDDTIETVGAGAFAGCTALASVSLPNCTEIAGNGFQGCASLTDLYLPKVETIGNSWIYYCPSIVRLELPSLVSAGQGVFYDPISQIKRIICQSLESIGSYCITDMPMLEYFDCGAAANKPLQIYENNFADATPKLKMLILRHDGIATLGGLLFDGTPIGAGRGYTYVPRRWLSDTDDTMDYRMASNWAAYSTQLRALEDYTVDGTVYGEIQPHNVLYMLYEVASTNPDVITGRSYHTTLESKNDLPVMSVAVTMGGEDITSDAYNAATNEIHIPSVTGDIVIRASTGAMHDIILTPYDGSDEGEIPQYNLTVTKGTVLNVTYYVTKAQGCVCHAGAAGGTNIYINQTNMTLNAETTRQITVPADGDVIFANWWGKFSENGVLAGYAPDRPYGRYIFVDIL